MKRMKKILALLLTIVMMMGLSVTAFAAKGTNDDSGKITINNAVVDQTYNIYQILILESYDTDAGEDGAYAYKAVPAWKDWLKEQTTYVQVDDQDYVTWIGQTDDATVAAFAKAALAYAQELVDKDEDGTPDTPRISATKSAQASGTTVEFTGLNLGYYLVDSSLGALCSLDTTDSEAIIKEKNEAPEIDKEVVSDPDVNEPSVGDSVNFKITVTAQKGAQNYVVHDTMSDGLTFNNDVVVKVGDTTLTAPNDYIVLMSPDVTDKCAFEIHFTEGYLNSISSATEIVVTYSATINNKAVISTDPETNSAKLDYGDDSSVKIDTDTKTYVYYFDLVKTDAEDILIDGAQFKLYESEEGTEAIEFVNIDGTYRVAMEDEISNPDISTTDTIIVSGGNVRITGLGEGTYYLEETVAPDGYNKLTDRISVAINSNNSATVIDNENGTYTYDEGGVQVENKAGSLLPSTGGMGTTLIYIAGAVLVIGAGILLVVRRRMNAEQ